MSEMKKMLPYFLVCELAFLLMVLIGVDTGGLMVLLFIVIPVVCFIASVIYGMLNPFRPIQLLYPLLVGALFTATFYFVSNEIIWIYTLSAMAVVFVGYAIGCLITRFRRRSK